MNNSLQIALTDLIRYVGIKEDGIVGHSIGEIAASYADGCTDYKETMLIAYFVGKIILDNKLTQGKHNLNAKLKFSRTLP